MINKILLRDINPRDFKDFIKWWRDKELIALTSGDFKEYSDEELKGFFNNKLNDKQNIHKVICLGGDVIGQASLVDLKDGYWELQIVIGKKNHRNKGYGQAAIKELIEIAKNLRIKQLIVEVRPTNMVAINAYKKVGFIESKLAATSKEYIVFELRR